MGHGLCAMMLGGHFEKLVIYSDGSGTAFYSGPLFLGRFGEVITAAAGPLLPSFAGALLILSSRHAHTGRITLLFLGSFLLLSAALWVRSSFGLVVIPSIGLCLLAVSLRASFHEHNFVVQFVGVQACVSVYRQIGYLFTKSAVINGQSMLSDTGQIGQILFLPYWIWGALISALSFLVLLGGLFYAYRDSCEI